MVVEVLVRRLGEAATFAEVSSVVSEHARNVLDVHQCTLTLFTTARTFAMVADDVTHGFTDAQRLTWIADSPIDPDLREMFATHGPVGDDDRTLKMHAFARSMGYQGPMLNMRCTPLVEPSGLLGSLRAGCAASLSRTLRRDMDVMASYAAAQLWRIGITAVAAPTLFDHLSRRQAQIVELVAQGFTNREIADMVEISVNTVKKQLKLVFAKLDVLNRTELAALVARCGVRDNLPPGISVFGGIHVTKAAGYRRDVAAV
jgi:DNA-binding CsgD family transcriptional regulator